MVTIRCLDPCMFAIMRKVEAQQAAVLPENFPAVGIIGDLLHHESIRNWSLHLQSKDACAIVEFRQHLEKRCEAKLQVVPRESSTQRSGRGIRRDEQLKVHPLNDTVRMICDEPNNGRRRREQQVG